MKTALQDIYLSASRDDAERAWSECVHRHEDKYPTAIKCLCKDKASLLSFLAMTFQLIKQAQLNWKKLPKIDQLQEVLDNLVFIDGVKVDKENRNNHLKNEAA